MLQLNAGLFQQAGQQRPSAQFGAQPLAGANPFGGAVAQAQQNPALDVKGDLNNPALTAGAILPGGGKWGGNLNICG